MKKRVCMNFLQALNFFEKKLRALSKAQKIQLYLIPIFTATFIVYHFVDIKYKTQPNVVEKLERIEVNSYSFLKQLEEFYYNQALNIKNMKQNGLKFTFQMEGEFLNLMQFILFCESFKSVNTIVDFKFSSNENEQTLWLELELASNKYEAKEEYSSLLALIQTLQNPFTTHSVIMPLQTLNFNIYAIVNNEVLLNDVWLKQGSTFGDYTLLEIHRRFVVLQKNDGEKRIVHLMKE